MRLAQEAGGEGVTPGTYWYFEHGNVAFRVLRRGQEIGWGLRHGQQRRWKAQAGHCHLLPSPEVDQKDTCGGDQGADVARWHAVITLRAVPTLQGREDPCSPQRDLRPREPSGALACTRNIQKLVETGIKDKIRGWCFGLAG